MELKERIIDYIDDMTATELVDLYNEYQRTTGNSMLIYHMSQLASVMCYYDLFDDVKSSFRQSKFNPNDKYFVVSNHTITSYYYLYDIDMIDVNAIAEFIVNNHNDLGNIFIEGVLEEEEYDV